MSTLRKLVTGSALVAALAATPLAQARPDVQWSISIGVPVPVVPVYSPAPVVVSPYPVYSPAPVVVAPYPVYSPAPVVYAPRPHHRHDRRYREARWDADRDGIPDRYDRVYSPRWDVDGDGVPNHHDRRPYDPRR